MPILPLAMTTLIHDENTEMGQTHFLEEENVGMYSLGSFQAGGISSWWRNYDFWSSAGLFS
jgi:hypothetical protein